MSELHQCLLRAIIRKKLGIKAPTPDLRIIGKEVPADSVMECLLRARIREIKGFKAKPTFRLMQGGRHGEVTV